MENYKPQVGNQKPQSPAAYWFDVYTRIKKVLTDDIPCAEYEVRYFLKKSDKYETNCLCNANTILTADKRPRRKR
jgi:hypothetical protein